MLMPRCAILAAILAPLTLCAGTLLKDLTAELDGAIRYWDCYVPEDLAAPCPVVVILHGGGQSKNEILSTSLISPFKEWLQIADESGLLLLVPNGVNRSTGLGTGTNLSWNDARADNTTTSTADDIAFFSLLLDWAEANFPVDTRRVYFTGSSNGGLMTYRVAQEMSHRVAAVAPFIANKPAIDLAGNPEFPVSVMICNGQGETLYMPWAGGYVSGNVNAGLVVSTPATRDYWVGINGCSPLAALVPYADLDPAEGSTAVRLLYTGGAEQTEVQLIIVFNGGHVIPSIEHKYNDFNLAAQGLGIQNHDIEGAREAWSFLARHPLGTTRSPGFSEWMAARGSNDPLDDADRDGINLLMTYALGADLLPSPRDALPSAGIASLAVNGAPEADFLTLRLTRRNAATGITSTWKRSSDLVTWSDAGGSLAVVGTTDHGNGTSTVVLRESEPIHPVGEPRFYRWSVMETP